MSSEKKILSIYPLTSMQEGMLYHLMQDGESGVYVEQTLLDISGELSADLLEKTFNCIIGKYDIFRTAFVYNKMDKPKQVVLSERFVEVTQLDYSKLSDAEKEIKIDEFLQFDKKRGFSIEQDTLIRLTILKKAPQMYLMVMTFSHLIMDGWCIGLILKDFAEIYGQLKNNETIKIKKGNSYGEYIKWVNRQDADEAEFVWKDYLAGIEKSTPLIEKSVAASGYDYKTINLRFGDEYLNSIKEFSKRNGITLNTFFQTVWGVLLQKYNDIKDAVFGVVVSGRSAALPDIESMVGLFINTIPLRVNSEGTKTFAELAKSVQDSFNKVRQYEYTSLAAIQALTDERENLINTLFVFENYPMNEMLEKLQTDNELGFKIINVSSVEQTNYDFNVTINPHAGLNIEFKFNGNVFSEEDVNIIADVFTTIVDEALGDREIINYEIVSENMQRRIESTLNFEKSHYPTEVSISQIFEAIVEKYPNKIAVEYCDETITYGQLNNRANILAEKLRKNNVKPNRIVGILLEASIEMAVSILAVIKAGGAYMPIDINYPENRKQFMLDDSGTEFLITRDKYLDMVKWDRSTIIVDEMVQENDCKNQECINSQSDRAYVIYTSGSTGKPKGTVITHKNVIRLLFNSDFQFDFSENDIWTCAHSFCFDFSVWEFYGALLYGGKLIILPKDIIMNPELFSEVIKEKNVTVLNQTPVSFYGIMEECKKRNYSNLALRYVIFGGEALMPSKLKSWRKLNPKCHLINMYGITETTVHVTYKEIEAEDMELTVSNIGRPIPTLSVSIRNKAYKRMPINVAGEICVLGEGLAEGYLNREELTAQKFIADPYNSSKRMYCSGDLGRLLPNGDIEYLGRIDNQIKIRGFRIEIGEIEAQLCKQPEIKDAVVLPKLENQSNTLYAYLVFNKKITVAQIRERLSENLPYYMIPSYFVEQDELPYTSNRKIDRKKLLLINDVMRSDISYSEITEERERLLAGIWKEVLGCELVGKKDNFFEMGGDSIKAIQIVSRLKKYNMILDVKAVMQYPVLEEMCRCIVSNDEVKLDEQVKGSCPFTPIQKQFLSENNEINHFNQAITISSAVSLDASLICQMINKLIEYHDALRLAVKGANGNYTQEYREYQPDMFIYESLQIDSCENDNYKKLEAVLESVHSRISLQDKIIGVVHSIIEEEHYLTLIIHHMVIDGVSWRILLEDLAAIYASFVNNKELTLLEKTASYKSWAQLLEIHAQSDEIKKEIEYWNGVIAADKIINDCSPNYEKDMERVWAYLSEEETRQLLHEVNIAYGTGINVILLTALVVAFNKSNLEDTPVISVEGHGRNHTFNNIDINRTVGWFTNMYPLAFECSFNGDWSMLIRTIKEMINRVPQEGFNYMLLKYLTDSEEIQFKDYVPKYSFNYLGNVDSAASELFANSSKPIGKAVGDNIITLFKMDINAMVKEQIFGISFRYNNTFFAADRVQVIAETYISVLREIIKHCVGAEKILSPTDMCFDDFSLEEFDELLKDIDI